MSASRAWTVDRTKLRLDAAADRQLSLPHARALGRAAWMIGGVGLACMVGFDLGPPLAFNDDWGMAWAVRHFNPLHVRLYPQDAPLALVQTVFAWLVTFGHPDQRWLRLSELAFAVLTMICTHRMARRLGAGTAWSGVAAVSPLAFPVFTADATTFMTDVPYVGLFSAAALGAVRWRDGRRWIALCVAFAGLATLQRQIGAAAAPAVTLWLAVSRRDGITRRDWCGLGALWGACLAAIALPVLMGITSPAEANRIQGGLTPSPVYILTAFLFLPGVLGLGLIPFLPGLVTTADSGPRRDRVRLAVFALALVELLVFAVNGGDVFPGNVFQPRGFNLTGLTPYLKPQLFPSPLFAALELGSVATAALLLRRRRFWSPAQVGSGGVCLLFLAAAQFLPLTFLHNLPYDRYYLPVVAMLVPLAARAASQARRQLLAGRLALGLVAAMIVVYVVGEQDFQAWEVARDQAARLAYAQASPYEVNAGYEANAVYGELPWYERTGAVLGGLAVPGAYDFSVDGPRHPKLTLQFAKPDDPAPGYEWSSLAPGKVVIRAGPS